MIERMDAELCIGWPQKLCSPKFRPLCSQTVRHGVDGAIEHGWKPVPFDRYRFAATRFYQDNFMFNASEK